MDCPNLGKRLLTIAELIPPCDTFLDVGTDHAYLPVYLIKKGVCKRAIASDLRKGPLDSAAKTAVSYGVSDRTDLRLGSGFETVLPCEADAAVVAGMGGILIAELMKNAESTVRRLKTLILQPMTAVYELRKFLYENDYTIERELLIKEDEKLYHILSASSKPSPPLTTADLVMGHKLYESESLHLAEYTSRQLNKLNKQIKGLEKATSEDAKVLLGEKKKLLSDIENFLEGKTVK